MAQAEANWQAPKVEEPKNILRCRAADAFNKKFPEELSYEEGEDLTVYRTSMSGWWYAVNSKGMDGLVPFYFLEVLEGFVPDFGELSIAEYLHIEKTVFGWDIKQIIQVVFQEMRETADEQNTLLHALRKLFLMIQREDDRFTFLSNQGLDQLYKILTESYDIAIRMFVLRLFCKLCTTQAAKRFPAQKSLAEGVVKVMGDYLNFPSFVGLAVDALSNICFQNETQRRLTAQSQAIPMMLAAMTHHRDAFGVHLSCSRAFANLLSEPRAQQQFDEMAVRTVVETLKAQFIMYDDDTLRGAGLMKQQKAQAEFAQQMMIILSHLLADVRKAQTFAVCGGFVAIRNLYRGVGVWDEPTRATIVSVLNNMSQSPSTAKLFTDNVFEGYDILIDLMAGAESYSQFFYQIFSIVTYLTLQLKSPILNQAVKRTFERGSIAVQCEKALSEKENVKLMEAVPTLLALAARTKDKEVHTAMIESRFPFKLVPFCVNDPPSKVFLNYSFIVFYNLSDDVEWAEQWIQAGLLAMVLSPWYRDFGLEDSTVQNGCVTLINLLKHIQYRLSLAQEQDAEKLLLFLKQHKSNMANVIQILDKTLKRQASLGSKGKGGKNMPKQEKQKKKGGQPLTANQKKHQQQLAQDDQRANKKDKGCIVM